jgi:hypothetical protein
MRSTTRTTPRNCTTAALMWTPASWRSLRCIYMAFIWHLYDIYMAFIWHLCGIYMAFIWHLYGIYMAFIWHLYGMYMAFIWHLQSIYMAFIDVYMALMWHLYGICMAFIWHLYGIYMAFIWHLYGICMAFVWHLYGICMTFIWHLYGICMTPHCYPNFLLTRFNPPCTGWRPRPPCVWQWVGDVGPCSFGWKWGNLAAIRLSVTAGCWLHDCLTIASRLPHDCLTIASRLPHDCLTIASRLPHDCLTIASRLPLSKSKLPLLRYLLHASCCWGLLFSWKCVREWCNEYLTSCNNCNAWYRWL